MTAWKLENIPTEEVGTQEQLRDVDPQHPGTASLAMSVKAHGIKQPLGGYRENGRVTLVWGHRRLAAAHLAELLDVPILIFDQPPTKVEALRAQLAENLNRVDLNPIDEANGFRRLIETTGETIASVASEFGLSEASVSKKLKLLSLSQPIQALIRTGQLAESAGYELTLLENPDPIEQLRLANNVVEGKLSRDALRGLIKRSTAKSSRKMPCRSARVILPLDAGSSLSWSGHDRSLDGLIDHLQTLLGKARKARVKGWELDTFARALRDQAKGEQV